MISGTYIDRLYCNIYRNNLCVFFCYCSFHRRVQILDKTLFQVHNKSLKMICTEKLVSYGEQMVMTQALSYDNNIKQFQTIAPNDRMLMTIYALENDRRMSFDR